MSKQNAAPTQGDDVAASQIPMVSIEVSRAKICKGDRRSGAPDARLVGALSYEH